MHYSEQISSHSVEKYIKELYILTVHSESKKSNSNNITM